MTRQFFFAVGKPHRPTDAKLTGEAAGRNYIPLFPSSMSFKGGLWIPSTKLTSLVSAQSSPTYDWKNPASRK
jgi:hypothetical protein